MHKILTPFEALALKDDQLRIFGVIGFQRATVILRRLKVAFFLLKGFHSGFQTPICLKISSGHNCTSDINSHGLSSLTKGPCLFYDECPTLHFNFRLQSFSNPSLDREP